MDDRDILDNIDGRMHGPMSGFIKKYFGIYQFVPQDGVLQVQAAGRVASRCAVPSTAPSPDNFLHWFLNYVSEETDGARGSWHVLAGSDNVSPMHENGAGQTASLLLILPSATSTCASSHANEQPKWDDVQVVGQFYQHNHTSYEDGLLHLSRSAFKVFSSQPTRLFVHGFYVRGSLVELWVFDRSGMYCSELLDVQKNFNQFLSVILSYQRMTDRELGRSNIIEADEGGSYTTIDGVATPALGKLYLENEPIASRDGLVGHGTTCYRARTPGSDRWDYVLKYKWRWARQRPEDELLKLAKKKSAWGAVSLDHYEELESTANLRSGLRWGTHRKFSRLQEDSSNENVGDRQQATNTTGGFFDFTEETGSFFKNRILTCSVTSPVGRPLHTFQSIPELLIVLRDAIKCHRSLLYNAKILHQDISPGNLIILDGQSEGEARGILIDLDSAVRLAEEEEETDLSIVGTRPFMAVGVLKGERHTYRHDLESFLYVLLWAIITNHADDPPETSKLRQWSNGDWDELAARKTLSMDQSGFRGMLDEFPPEFHPLKSLAETLRQILFPQQAGAIWTGTDSSTEATERLYDEIICAFDEAIALEGSY